MCVRSCGAGYLICPVSDEPAWRSGLVLHRDREGDGVCGASYAVHQRDPHREEGGQLLCEFKCMMRPE